MTRTTRKTSAEPTIATGTLRSHPWHDHSFRRVSRMTELAAPGYLECRVLKGGRFEEKPALPTVRTSVGYDENPARTRAFGDKFAAGMMTDLLAIMSPVW